MVVDFLSPFVRLTYMIGTAYFNVFCYFRKKKKEGTVEGSKSHYLWYYFYKNVISIQWWFFGLLMVGFLNFDLTLSFLDQVLGRLYFVT